MYWVEIRLRVSAIVGVSLDWLVIIGGLSKDS
jgi:hypothetical protein